MADTYVCIAEKRIIQNDNENAKNFQNLLFSCVDYHDGSIKRAKNKWDSENERQAK